MTTTTDFDAAVDQALLISHDWEPVCEFAICPFGRPLATHIAYLPCGCEPLGCTPSAEQLHQDILGAIKWCNDLGRCNTCKAYVTASEIRIEPLP